MRLVVEIGQELGVALSRGEAFEARSLCPGCLQAESLEMLPVRLPRDLEVAVEHSSLRGCLGDYFLVRRQVLLRP